MAAIPKSVNVAGLVAAAANYDTVLRTLPAVVLAEKATKLGLRMLSENNKVINTEFLRKGNLIRPYVSGGPETKAGELGKFRQIALDPVTVKADVRDNVTNYDGVPLLGSVLSHDPKLKKLPIEAIVLSSIIESGSEDFLYVALHGIRNDAGTSALDSFDGVNKQIASWVTAGEISEANKNLIATGACPDENATVSPAAAGAAYKWAVNFIRALNPMLRNAAFSLQISLDLQMKLQDSCNKLYPQFQGVANLLERLRYDGGAPLMQLVSDFTIGSGDCMRAVIPGWADFSLSTSGSDKFIQVRNPFADPNEVQYWLQARCATRLNTIHKKVFATNDQLFSAVDFRGDY